MAIKSGFFNSVNGDRKYDANRFAEYFATFIGNGVFPNPSDNLQVIANDDMTVTVKVGKAWINGYILINDDDYILEITPADGVLNRIDRIVARYDTVDREIRLEVKQGNYASSPEPPVLQRDADAYELGLADISVNKGVISITQANITDLRLNSELCGIVHGTVDEVDTTTIFNQYQAWFNSITGGTEQEIADWQQQQYDDFMIWFATIQDVLDGDTAGNLLKLINEHKADDVSQGEIHGLRVNNEKLEYYTGTEWKIASGGIPVGNVSGLSVGEDDAEITLMWTDPEDRYLDDLKIAEWQGTKIIRKEGSYPVSDDDGVLVVDNTIKNQYAVNGYKDTGLTNEVTYYYMAFPYTEDAITVDGANRVSAIPTEIDPDSWKGIQKIVRKGLASDFFTIGDQLVSGYDGGEIVWEVIGIDVETPADSQYQHSMTLQTRDCLHNIQFDAPEPSNPDSNRKSYGNNRYIHSAVKQWLNSDEAKFSWQSKHQYDAKPTSSPDLYDGEGFLHRLDPELVAVLGNVKKKVALNTVTDGGGQEEFTDKIFLLSQKEVDLGDEGVNTGEFVYPFYQGKGNANRIKRLSGSESYWWLRSPNVSYSNYVRHVNTGGSLNFNRANLTYGVSPACVII